jgi:hypothetical protein
MPQRLVLVPLLLAAGVGLAQTKPKPAPVQQLVKPPVAQAWIDLATHHSDIPGMAGAMGQMMSGGGMPSLGQLMGRGDTTRGNVFGQTQGAGGGMGFGGSGQFLDSAVFTRANKALSDATQAVPSDSLLAPTLQLIAPQPEKPVYEPPSEREPDREPSYEKPKGKMLLYWGCSETVREGQPRVLDFATMNLADVQRIMVARGSTPQGARSQPGVPAWPNKTDDRQVPAGSRLAGEHAFKGQGIPESFRFTLRPEVDFMPAIALQRQPTPAGATALSWQPVTHARAYFVSAMGGKPGANDEAEMVMWSSSELPDTGFALHDYQTPGGIERLLKDKVILPPETTQCAIPAGIFGSGREGGGGMLRMVAYGPEQGAAYPARPADPKVPWEPEWSARVRTKSTLFAVLGMQGAAPAQEAPPEEPKKKPKVTDLLNGLLGR